MEAGFAGCESNDRALGLDRSLGAVAVCAGRAVGCAGGHLRERMRWLERFVAFGGIVLGWTGAGLYRDLFGVENAGDWIGCLRRLFYPAGLLTASGLLWFEAWGREDAAGVVVTGFVAYGLGVWFACRDLLPLPSPETGANGEGD